MDIKMNFLNPIKKVRFIKKKKKFKKIQLLEKMKMRKRNIKKDTYFLLILKKNYKRIKQIVIMKKNIKYLIKKITLIVQKNTKKKVMLKKYT